MRARGSRGGDGGPVLLARDAFRAAVFARDGGRCLPCGAPAADAHHILERRLFPDGGYYLDNGASVCASCHLLAERTSLSAERLRELAGTRRVVLPPFWDDSLTYTKWGDIVLSGGRRARGPLFAEESVQRILAQGVEDGSPVLSLYVRLVPYPRTPHLPDSPGVAGDDKVIASLAALEAAEVVATVKADGESATIYPDGTMHARGTGAASHPSQAWIRRFAAEKGPELPAGWRLCGENLYAVHSIRYDLLPSWFFAISLWDDSNRCLSWDDTALYAAVLDVPTVAEFYRGPFDRAAIGAAFLSVPGTQEGYVVRDAAAFPYATFGAHVAKWVRAGHQDESRHYRRDGWRATPETVNGIARGAGS